MWMSANRAAEPSRAAAGSQRARGTGRTMPRNRVSSHRAGMMAMAVTESTACSKRAGPQRPDAGARKPSRNPGGGARSRTGRSMRPRLAAQRARPAPRRPAGPACGRDREERRARSASGRPDEGQRSGARVRPGRSSPWPAPGAGRRGAMSRGPACPWRAMPRQARRRPPARGARRCVVERTRWRPS